MYTERPVPSVLAGTVTLNVRVTVRGEAVAETVLDGSERLKLVSRARI